MSVAECAVPQNHFVQLYEDERSLHHTITAFFATRIGDNGVCAMAARPRTYEAVKESLLASRDVFATQTAEHMQFVDAEAAATILTREGVNDRGQLERRFEDIFKGVCPKSAEQGVRLYGEIVDVLCERGHYATAVQLEDRWNAIASGYPRMVVLCAYSVARFRGNAAASHLDAICLRHTQVISTTGFPDKAGESVFRGNVANTHLLTREPPPTSRPGTALSPAPPIVYVVDDDPSIRRSLTRLFSAIGLQVRTFESAEQFLLETDSPLKGCLLLDIQLGGMSGLDLQKRLTCLHPRLPVIAMSGSTDLAAEFEALRRGATVFLRKPFDGPDLLDVIARLLS